MTGEQRFDRRAWDRTMHLVRSRIWTIVQRQRSRIAWRARREAVVAARRERAEAFARRQLRLFADEAAA